MRYKKAWIYFLSGTGNSFRVAVWFASACKKAGLAVAVIPIDKADPKADIASSPEDLIVMAYPTHGFLPPWSAIKFMFKLPFKRGVHIFAVPTRGCFRLGPVFVPGVAAVASMLPALLAPFKGYRFRGSLSFDMPANMISLHSGLSEKNIGLILDAARRKADKFFPRLLSGRRIWFTWNNFWEYGWGILLLRFFPLFPVVYLLIGRFFMGKMMFANNDCIGCGLCARSCPNQAIVMKGKKQARPYWRHNCEDCLRCMNFCRRDAVEVGHSWGILLYLVSLWVFPFAFFVFRFVERYWPQVNVVQNWYTLTIVSALFVYPAFMVAYYVFFQLIRIKSVNTLFTYTTLTHYYRRYHEPETDLSDLLEAHFDDEFEADAPNGFSKIPASTSRL